MGKIIQPNNLSSNNFIKDILYSNNKLICQYQEDTLSYVFNFDLSGNLSSVNSIQLGPQERTTNLELLNDSLYVVKNLTNNPFGEALIKMDNSGNYSCSSATTFSVNSYSFGITTSQQSLGPASYTYSMSNIGFNAYTYSIGLSNDCVATSIKHLGEKIPVNVYPNPASDLVTIEADVNIQRIEVTNLTGQVLLSEKIDDKKYQLQLANLSKGMYFVKIIYSDELFVTKKMIINH